MASALLLYSHCDRRRVRVTMGSAVSCCGKGSAADAPQVERVEVQPQNSWKRDLKISTPIRAAGAEELEGLDYTPGPREQEKFKYYCPLCMCYFQRKCVCSARNSCNLLTPNAGSDHSIAGILKTTCCENYACFTCGSGYLYGKQGGCSHGCP